jgi:hypothetical protein
MALDPMSMSDAVDLLLEVEDHEGQKYINEFLAGPDHDIFRQESGTGRRNQGRRSRSRRGGRRSGEAGLPAGIPPASVRPRVGPVTPSANVHVLRPMVPPVIPAGGIADDRPAIAFKSNGLVTDDLMDWCIRRGGETRAAAEARSYHPDALPTLLFARILTATAERLADREFSIAEQSEFVVGLWPLAEAVVAQPEAKWPSMLMQAVTELVRINLPLREKEFHR